MAEQSRETTAIIDEMVANLVADAKKAVSNVELSNQLLNEQRKSVENTKSTFDQINDASKTNEKIVDVLSNACSNMTSRKQVASDNIDELTAIAQQNAAAAEQASASMDLQSENADHIAKASEKLASMAHGLNDAIHKFQI